LLVSLVGVCLGRKTSVVAAYTVLHAALWQAIVQQFAVGQLAARLSFQHSYSWK